MSQLIALLKAETNSIYPENWYKSTSKKIIETIYGPTDIGYVYIVKNGKNSLNFKLGNAIDLKNRILSYTTAFENPIHLVGYLKCENYIKVEGDLKKKFESCKTRGEFFELSYEDFKIFRQMKFTFVESDVNSKIWDDVLRANTRTFYYTLTEEENKIITDGFNNYNRSWNITAVVKGINNDNDFTVDVKYVMNLWHRHCLEKEMSFEIYTMSESMFARIES